MIYHMEEQDLKGRTIIMSLMDAIVPSSKKTRLNNSAVHVHQEYHLTESVGELVGHC